MYNKLVIFYEVEFTDIPYALPVTTNGTYEQIKRWFHIKYPNRKWKYAILVNYINHEEDVYFQEEQRQYATLQ